MLRYTLAVLVVIGSLGSLATAQEKLRPDVDLPSPGEYDRWDYNVYFAWPARIGYRLEEYSLNGRLLNVYEHDSYESALEHMDFLETRMMLDYRIVEFRFPQRWFFDSRHDTYPHAYTAAMRLRRLGLDSEIRKVTDWEFARR